MKYVDAHIHLSDEEYQGKTDEIMAEAKAANIIGVVSNSVDIKTCARSLELVQKHKGLVFAALGVHPWNVQSLKEEELAQTVKFISEHGMDDGVVSIGEVGLDSKYRDVWDKQVTVFDEMLHLGEKLDLPVVIHSRGTTDDIVNMLPSYDLKRVLLHWFSNPITALDRAIDRGYFITEGPPAIDSKSIREVVRKAPLANLMTETDGPVRYFRKPFEGKRTTPALIPAVISAIAEIKNLSIDIVANQILRNFEEFFGVKLN